MKNKNNEGELIDGFKAISDFISATADSKSKEDIINLPDDETMDDKPSMINEDDIADDSFVPPIVDQKLSDDKSTETSATDDKDKVDEDDINDDTDDTLDNTDADDVLDLGEYEKDAAAYLKHRLEEIGVTFYNDTNIESVEDIADYLSEIMDQNSDPIYPSDEVRELAKYVENGGDLKNFYDNVHYGIDLDKIDVENELDQRAIVMEDLKNKGYSKTQIDRKIKRYEEAGVLEEESLESLEAVKEFRKKTQEKLLLDQEKIASETRERQQKFVTDVHEGIKNIEKIVKFPVSEKEKREMENYILKTDNSGVSDYVRDYYKDPVGSLIEAAYFRKNRDILLDKIKMKQESDVTKTFRKKLESIKEGKTKSSSTDRRYSTTGNVSLGSLRNYL